MSAPYNFEKLFFIFGGGVLVVAICGWLAGILSPMDVVCASVVAYLVLRVTNAMSREDSNRSKRR